LYHRSGQVNRGGAGHGRRSQIDIVISRWFDPAAVAGATKDMVLRLDPALAEWLRLVAEVERLRMLLRQHGVEPDGGTTRSA